MDKPKKMTVPEALDAARDGKEFMQVIQSLFAGLEVAMDQEREEEN